MQLGPFLVLVLLAQAAADGWTAAGTTRGVTLAFRDDPQLELREVRATTELSVPAARIFPLVLPELAPHAQARERHVARE
jgi:hypothetical protein